MKLSAGLVSPIDWAALCCYCHERPRTERDRVSTFGFCRNIDCEAERTVADAMMRAARDTRARAETST